MQQAYLLKKLKTTRFPKRFIVLRECQGCANFSVLDYQDGLWEEINLIDLLGKSVWWTDLPSRIRARETVWIVGWKMYETLCALGIYEALETGLISLKRRKRKVKGDKANTVWEQQAGALVCDSPPTIIDLEFPGKRYVRCIDLCNWGLDHEWLEDAEYQEDLEGATAALQDYVAMVYALEMGSLQSTAAAQGYCRFRTHDLEARIAVHQDAGVRTLERRSYFGGRCEAFQVGPIPGPLYYVDVKAMYSHIAATKQFPVDLIDQGEGLDLYGGALIDDMIDPGEAPKLVTMARIWESPLITSHCTAEVEINSRQPRYPCRIGMHTYYPVGRFRTVLCGAEFEDAVSSDSVSWIGRWATYKTDYVWRQYATWYFNGLGRLSILGLGHMRSALKLAVNASYGKVGARGKRWIDTPPDGTAARWGQWWRDHPLSGEMTQGRAIDGIHQYLDQGGEPSSSIPSIAAAMNAYGRVWANRLLDQIGRENVYYWDTDGGIVSEAGVQNCQAVIASKLDSPGDLTIREIGADGWIGGLKHYRIGNCWVQSGVPSDARRTTDGRAEWTDHEPFAYGLWHGEPFSGREQDRTRYGCRPYEHGTVRADRRIEPFRADVLEGPYGPETVIYGRHGEILESLAKNILTIPRK